MTQSDIYRQIIRGLLTALKRGNAHTADDALAMAQAEAVLVTHPAKACFDCGKPVDNPQYDICSECDV